MMQSIKIYHESKYKMLGISISTIYNRFEFIKYYKLMQWTKNLQAPLILKKYHKGISLNTMNLYVKF